MQCGKGTSKIFLQQGFIPIQSKRDSLHTFVDVRLDCGEVPIKSSHIKSEQA